MNDIFKRRSVREYLDKDVSIDIVKEMICAAMQAPSAMKQIPWHFVLIDKPHIKDLLDCSHGAMSLKECDKAVVFVMDTSLRCPEFLEQDMSSAIENFMLEGANNGIGTIWIGTYPHEDRVNYLRNYLNIKNPFTPYAIIGLGYPKNKDAFKILDDRFDLSRIHLGKW